MFFRSPFIPNQLAAVITSGLILLSVNTRIWAAPYTSGDLLMGFVTGSGLGADDTVVVRLGTAASFRDAFDAGTNQLNIANIGTQLRNLYSPTGGDIPWYDRTDLYVSVFASTDSDTIGDTLVNGDPFRTIYASRSRSNAGSVPGTARSTPWTLPSNTATTTTSGQIVSTALAYSLPSVTADASGLSIIPKTAGNSLDEYTKPTRANSFTNFNGGIEFAFAAGAWGTLGDAGSTEAALDIYRLQAVNNISGQYGLGNPVRSGVYKGSFTINQTGQISFIARGNAPVDGFNTWAVGKGLPSGVATTDDRDFDNIPALVEYGLDLNPLAFSSLPAPTQVAGGLQFAFTKGAAAAADPQITFQIEASTQLASGWTTLAPTTNNSSQIAALLPFNDPAGRLFARLKVVKAN